jgi:hypothetical protein
MPPARQRRPDALALEVLADHGADQVGLERSVNEPMFAARMASSIFLTFESRLLSCAASSGVRIIT